VIPEYNWHLVTSGLRTFIEEGGIFLEIMPPPFYLCYFKEDETLVSMIDILAEQYRHILTKSSGFDRRLKLTETGKEILGSLRIPDSVFSANKGAVISTLYNYSSKPGLSLITTDQEEPLLDVLTIGKGRIVRWGCNLEAPFKDFLFKSLTRIVKHLIQDPSFKKSRVQPHKGVIVSISPVNYWVGNTTRQKMSLTILNELGKPIKDLTVRIKLSRPHRLIYQRSTQIFSAESHLIFETEFDPKDSEEWSVEALADGIIHRKDFKPFITARGTVFIDSALKNAQPKSHQPEGFEDFWNHTIEEATEIEGGVEEVLDRKRSTSTMLLYRVYFKSLGNDRIHGWFCRPNKEEKGPAILLLPGYSDGSKFIPLNLINEGCSILALDPRGHGESVYRIERTFPGFITRDILDRFRYPYRGVYIDCFKAVEYLLSNPYVDEKRVGVMGMSQGGGLALLTAALEKRVAFTIADSPFLTDMNHGIKYATDGPYVELAEHLQKNPSEHDTILENLSYFDIVNFIGKVKCPALMCVGLLDTVCPPITAYSTFNSLRCTKRMDVYPRMGHFCGVYGHQERKLEWIRKYLNLG
jgi:cephalosporin-C deacetylase